MNFKEFAELDTMVIFQSDEFESVHLIDGQSVRVIIDNERLKERSKKEFDGLSIGEMLYYVQKTALIKRPVKDQLQMFDNRQMLVFDVREEPGIYEVILTQNRG